MQGDGGEALLGILMGATWLRAFFLKLPGGGREGEE